MREVLCNRFSQFNFSNQKLSVCANFETNLEFITQFFLSLMRTQKRKCSSTMEQEREKQLTVLQFVRQNIEARNIVYAIHMHISYCMKKYRSRTLNDVMALCDLIFKFKSEIHQFGKKKPRFASVFLVLLL